MGLEPVRRARRTVHIRLGKSRESVRRLRDLPDRVRVRAHHTPVSLATFIQVF